MLQDLVTEHKHKRVGFGAWREIARTFSDRGVQVRVLRAGGRSACGLRVLVLPHQGECHVTLRWCGVPVRQSVYKRGRRILHPGNYRGRWIPEEEAMLVNLVRFAGLRGRGGGVFTPVAQVAEHGPQWTKIGAMLTRFPNSVREKWSELKNRDDRTTGAGSILLHVPIVTTITAHAQTPAHAPP